jgi:hypothetical protein
MNHLIPLIVFTILALWNSPPIREKLFAKVKRLPQWAQPIPPVLLAGIAAMGQGIQDGVSGDALLELGASGAGQYGATAIGIYHVSKRWLPVVVRLWRTFRNYRKVASSGQMSTLLVLVVATGCTPAARQQIARDATESACAIKLSDSPKVREYAEARDIPAPELAALVGAVLVKDEPK